MKLRMNAVRLIAGALLFQGAIAQAEPAPGPERKADVAGANAAALDGAKGDASEAGAVRETALSPPAPERSVAPGKGNTITLPQIPVDQLGLGCAE